MNLLCELEPITVRRHPAPFSAIRPRRDGDRKSNDQKSRQMMRPDINQIEVKRERQHHYRVLGVLVADYLPVVLFKRRASFSVTAPIYCGGDDLVWQCEPRGGIKRRSLRRRWL